MGYEVNQLFIAESFKALYLDARGRITVSRDELEARQELCEDLSQSLTEHCLATQARTDASTNDVLAQVRSGLLQGASSLSEAEARWVTIRTAELLQWDVPEELSASQYVESRG